MVRLTERVADFQTFTMSDLELVGQNIASWNQLAGWLREIAALREAAEVCKTSPRIQVRGAQRTMPTHLYVVAG